ncbi:negative regulator of sigma E activity [Spongiibacter sp. IMCC21906]|uniref:sigma-E factor negative regulatory protein n=1 Tax=Spongiibacter sp. IMCC21906 TaxID=1620392 RepID=UPI00062DCDB3|nr:sigma-E factor negative regulatory protein [Spongiibacter sp. IMCC21906]AKH69503.1 negative regulator of sigma E activity [Spongiibacter sp. IMCC21906]
MNDTLKESLSALLDGEANDLELRRVLGSEDKELREHWAELNRAQQLRQDGVLPFANLDISQRVMAEIADETLVTKNTNGWRQALSGVAVAASVAAVVVFGAMGTDMLGGSSDTVVASASPNTGRVYPAQAAQSNVGGVPVSAQVQTAPAPQPALDDEAQKRFEMYLRRHTDNAAQNSGQGVMTYSRVVAPESK